MAILNAKKACDIYMESSPRVENNNGLASLGGDNL